MRSHLVRLLTTSALLMGVVKPGPAQSPPEPPRLVAQTGTGTIHGVAFSPDGKRVFTGGMDTTARLWDVDSARELRRFEAGKGTVAALALSPDGKRLLTAHGGDGAYLWDSASGRQLRHFHAGYNIVSSVAFSPDGKHALTGDWNNTARLWDVESGKELRSFRWPSAAVLVVAFSPDGKWALTGGADKVARLWDVATAAVVRSFEGHSEGIQAVAFSPDGKRVVTGGKDNTARLWDAETGKPLRSFEGHSGWVLSVAFSPDGRRLLTGSLDQTARLWDAETGKELRRFRGRGGDMMAVAFAPDGRRVLAGSYSMAWLWDGETGQELGRFEGHSEDVRAVAFSPDGRRLFTAGDDGAARVWDGATGQGLRTVKGPRAPSGLSAAFSPDGRRLFTMNGGASSVWDAVTGKELCRLKGHSGRVCSAAFSPDGKHVLTAGVDRTARLWAAESGREVRRFEGHEDEVYTTAFSPDGRLALTGGKDKVARLWDAETGKELRALRGHSLEVGSVTFSPDGKRILTGSGDQTARLWDADTGRELRRFEGHTQWVISVALSQDGKRALTGSRDQTARLWDAESGKELFCLRGHVGPVWSVAISPDGRRALSGGSDTTTRLWDSASGKELCRLIGFLDGTWAVVDDAGRYDASNGGDVEGLHWVVGDEPIALSQLKERYYDPGLLAKHLGFSKEPPRDVAAFKDVKLYPAIAVAQKDAKKPQLDVTLTNRGGGIGRVVVLVNGKELTEDARPRGGADADAAKLDFPLDLANDPRLVPGQKNRVEVLAYNADGYLCSRGMVREFDGPGPAAAAPPRLVAVVAGTSEYHGGKLNLRYAAKDARDFAVALRLAARRFFGADNVHVTLLMGACDETRPSRARLVEALEALKATRPGDVVVVYLAGHGVTKGGQDGDWHYLTADAQSADLADPEVRKQVSLSSAELADLLKAAPAQKQVLILDTCHSGRFIDKITEKRDVPGSQVRALERVKDRTGIHVLAGCAADSVSYEATRYGQGLLTYSLLLAMRGAKLREGEYVDVAELFGYAADKVPELARDVGGVQRPLIASPRGASFDVGRLTAEDRKKVPLQAVKPVVVRSSFQLEKPARDSLALSRRIDERLREASAAARGAKLVYVGADDFPGGVQASGRYKVDGDKVTVSVSLYQGDKELAAFTVEGAADKPDDLAAKIVAEVEKKLPAGGGK